MLRPVGSPHLPLLHIISQLSGTDYPSRVRDHFSFSDLQITLSAGMRVPAVRASAGEHGAEWLTEEEESDDAAEGIHRLIRAWEKREGQTVRRGFRYELKG